MTTIKTEGFQVPGAMAASSRPHISRPFSDGSMTIETDMLASLDRSSTLSNASPFAFSQSLPGNNGMEQYMPSPHSASLDVHGSSNANSFSSMFSHFRIGTDNPEPPIQFPNANSDGHRSRSLSATRSSLVGKAPSSKSRSARKNSLSEARPPPNQIRGRPPQLHPRTMSQNDAFASRMSLGILLDTHKEDVRTDSVSPPDVNNYNHFSTSATRHSFDAPTWASLGSAPSLVPGSFGSYGVSEDVVTDSPVTPAHPLPPQLPDEESYKKQRRRECHNQVEKRRREHINAMIEQLSKLLPAHYNQNDEAVEDDEDEEVATSGKKKRNKRTGSSAKSQKDAAHCKGRILSQSVQYISDLRHMSDMQAARVRHLESLLLSQQTGSGQTNPFLWANGNPAMEAFGNSDGAINNQLPSLAEHHLEVMPRSPGAEPWKNDGQNDKSQGLMSFDMSPENASPNQNRRSSSLLTPESIEIEPKVNITRDGYTSSHENDSPRMVEHQQEMKQPINLPGMDIEAMFGVRREEAGGMRW